MLLILGEPFVSIDKETRKTIKDPQRKMKKTTILLPTHILLPELGEIFDKALLLDNGRLIDFNTASKMIKDYVKEL